MGLQIGGSSEPPLRAPLARRFGSCLAVKPSDSAHSRGSRERVRRAANVSPQQGTVPASQGVVHDATPGTTSPSHGPNPDPWALHVHVPALHGPTPSVPRGPP